jgi:pyrimidine-nucleoside phosphorylase
LLGAGRNTKEDVIDPAAGICLIAKTGDFVEVGAPIATLYSEKQTGFAAAEERIHSATKIGETAPKKEPLIFDIVE